MSEGPLYLTCGHVYLTHVYVYLTYSFVYLTHLNVYLIGENGRAPRDLDETQGWEIAAHVDLI